MNYDFANLVVAWLYHSAVILLQGETEFHEAESFKVLLNITAPSIQDAYAVNSQLVETDGNVLLQVVSKSTDSNMHDPRLVFAN